MKKAILILFLVFIIFSIGVFAYPNKEIELGDLIFKKNNLGYQISHKEYSDSPNDFAILFAENGWNWLNAQTGESVYIGIGYDAFYSAGGDKSPNTNNFYRDIQLNDFAGNRASVLGAEKVEAKELCLFDEFGNEICLKYRDLRRIIAKCS